ncbi:MAG: DNA repair protein RecO [Candidatus Schekmanbacteria bacterium]|nr:DNA repair protein RecO [Candidatus Schekmanbacteria bacterium]
MGLITTDGVVLKALNSGESDKILCLITPRMGKLSVMAKGSRKIRNRFSGALEEGNRVRATIYRKKDESLGFLSQCDILDTWKEIREDLDHTAGLFYILSLVNELVPEGEPGRECYDLLVDVLKVSIKSKDIFKIITFFEMNLLRLMGIGPVVTKCVICGLKTEENRVAFSNIKGGIMCPKCSDVNLKTGSISLGALKTLNLIGKQGLRMENNIRISKDCRNDISNFIYPYMVYHTGKEIKARKVLKQMDLI